MDKEKIGSLEGSQVFYNSVFLDCLVFELGECIIDVYKKLKIKVWVLEIVFLGLNLVFVFQQVCDFGSLRFL